MTNFLILLTLTLCFFQICTSTVVYLFYIVGLITSTLYVFDSTVVIKLLVIPLWFGTINIHPPLFYLSFLLFFLKLSYSSNFFSTSLVFFRYSTILNFSVLALYLGGLWGLQSVTWGYVWVNDGIEWSLLLLILFILVQIHSSERKFIVIYKQFGMFLIFTFLILIRLNIIATRHSFFSQQQATYFILFVFSVASFFILNFNNLKLPSKLLFFSFYNYVLLFYFFNNNTLFLSFLLKYYFSYLSFYLYYKILNIFQNWIILLLHSIIMLILLSWSISLPYFSLNFSLYKFSLSNVSYYFKLSKYNFLSYTNEIGSQQLLELVSFKLQNTSVVFIHLINAINFLLIFKIFNVLIMFFIINILLIFN